jgi:hypothetical protein
MKCFKQHKFYVPYYNYYYFHRMKTDSMVRGFSLGYKNFLWTHLLTVLKLTQLY